MRGTKHNQYSHNNNVERKYVILNDKELEQHYVQRFSNTSKIDLDDTGGLQNVAVNVNLV